MHSQRKCKFTSTVAGGMHPAGSKNSLRCYCSLVACPTYKLVSFKRRIPRFTDTILQCRSRLLSLLVKRKDIGFADRYFYGNRMRKRCLIGKRISIPNRNTGYFFSSSESSEIRAVDESYIYMPNISLCMGVCKGKREERLSPPPKFWKRGTIKLRKSFLRQNIHSRQCVVIHVLFVEKHSFKN